jgi:dUTPase
MVLKVFVDSKDNELTNKYISYAENHNTKLLNSSQHIDAGFDLFAPGKESNDLNTWEDVLTFYGTGYDNDISPVNKLDMKICCSARMYLDTGKNFNTGYYMYPRSSLSKTQLRLSNSTGIIDSGYRGHLTGMFDVVNTLPYTNNIFYGKKFDRYLQICAPGLVPIVVEIVNNKEELGEETERGSGGFGSTGR